MAGKGAVEVLCLSLRHASRIVAAYQKEGTTALAHVNQGGNCHSALDGNLRRHVVELAQSTYAGCNVQHFAELLADQEGSALSRFLVGAKSLINSFAAPFATLRASLQTDNSLLIISPASPKPFPSVVRSYIIDTR